MEWFESSFGAEYMALYAHRDASEARQAVQLILNATRLSAGSRVLDAPCGAGRHSREFAAAGMHVVGADLSRALLDSAAGQSVLRGRTAVYCRADLRSLPLRSESFDLVTNLFTSLGYFEAEEQNLQAVLELARACRNGGHLVIDFMNASHVKANFRETSERITASGCRVVDRRWISSSPERVNKHTTAATPAGEEKEFSESVRLYTADELKSMMEQAGVPSLHTFGDYSGAAWSLQSPRVILVGRKL